MNKVTEEKGKQPSQLFPRRLISVLADEIAKTIINRLPHVLPTRKKATKKKKNINKIDHAVFLDTSAIIDGRIFDVIDLGFVTGTVIVIDSILLELKHIADSQDAVKRERGKKGLSLLEKLRKSRAIKLKVIPDSEENGKTKAAEVDERLIKAAKDHKGIIITCDYNLEKKATIDNVRAINVNGLAHALKVTAVPGEALHITVAHHGKDQTQGVGYLDDGTMIVVENGREDMGKAIDVVVSRVIQTASGRILFAKKL